MICQLLIIVNAIFQFYKQPFFIYSWKLWSWWRGDGTVGGLACLDHFIIGNLVGFPYNLRHARSNFYKPQLKSRRRLSLL